MVEDLKSRQDGTTTAALHDMVAQHYDNPTLMALRGEIHFDAELSAAEIAVVLAMHERFGTCDTPAEVYAPCAGTMRHIPPLLEAGVQRVVAVDLSSMSLQEGQNHYGDEIGDRVAVHNTDIRNIGEFAPKGGFQLGFLMGNSLGDVTDVEGHKGFIQALSSAMAPDGVLVFDYVGDRYNPPAGEVFDTTWPDAVMTQEGEYPVNDRRTRHYVPGENGMGILHLTCEVTHPDGEVIVPMHNYDKLIVPDGILAQQFAEAGMTLFAMGPLHEHSKYHADRNETVGDLGMMGPPNHLYVAVKR